MSNKLNTIEYTLPDYWACYLVNDDASGLMDGEKEQVDAWVERMQQHLGTRLFSCCDVSATSRFSWRNDADRLGGNVADFTFLID